MSGYRRPQLSNLLDVSSVDRADQRFLQWDADSDKHLYRDLNIAAVIGLQSVLNGISSDVGTRVVANAAVSSGTATKISFDEKGLVTGGAAATTADIDGSFNRRYVTDEQLALLLNTSGTNTGDQDLSGYSQIGHTHAISEVTGLQTALDLKADLVDGYIPTSQIPAIAISEFLGRAADEDAMLLLEGQRGDYCYREDLEAAFWLTSDDPTDANNWLQVALPSVSVQSVNEQTGAVVLGYSDVGAAAATHGHEIADVTGLQSALNGKAASSHTHTIADITDLPVIAKSSTGDALVQANATGTINDSFLPAYLARVNAASTTWTGNHTFNAAGSSDESPREIVITGLTGHRGRIGVAGTGNSIQGGNGYKTQINSYWTLELSGDRRTGVPSFVNGLDDMDVSVRIYSVLASSRPLAIDGALGQSGSMTVWRNHLRTHLSAVSKDGFFLAPAGSAAAPSLSFLGDQNTGIYSSTADTLEFSTGGVRQAYLNSGGLTLNTATDQGAFRWVGSSGFGLRIHNNATGGADYRIGVSANSWAISGEAFIITPDNTSVNSVFTIRNGFIGLGSGNVYPKATIHGIGSTILGAATSAVSDANMGNGQINPYVDEVAHTLKIKVKYSNGTIRTATIALVA